MNNEKKISDTIQLCDYWREKEAVTEIDDGIIEYLCVDCCKYWAGGIEAYRNRKIPKVVIGIDRSGSIPQSMIEEFAEEIKKI